MNPIKSFREYVEKLEEHGELCTIDKEVDWNLEMGAIIRRVYELPAQAPIVQARQGLFG
jgi:4-hydroxy-3-polyprenylbenzoate decarboxylase